MEDTKFTVHPYNGQWIVEIQLDKKVKAYRLFRDEFSAYRFIHLQKNQ